MSITNTGLSHALRNWILFQIQIFLLTCVHDFLFIIECRYARILWNMRDYKSVYWDLHKADCLRDLFSTVAQWLPGKSTKSLPLSSGGLFPRHTQLSVHDALKCVRKDALEVQVDNRYSLARPLSLTGGEFLLHASHTYLPCLQHPYSSES